MEVTFEKPSMKANLRVIVKDEETKRSISFGVYNKNLSRDELRQMLKKYLQEIHQ